MFLWFVVFSVLGVYAVFRDDRMDYRFVVAGALLPDLVDGIVKRGVGPLHSLLVGVGLLFGVVIATVGRRSARKRWLAVPIGVFAHQVLDAAWADTAAFWWPVTGWRVDGGLPVVTHGLVVGIIQELVALAAAVWMWRSFDLGNPRSRAALLRTGQLPQNRPQRRRKPARRK